MVSSVPASPLEKHPGQGPQLQGSSTWALPTSCFAVANWSLEALSTLCVTTSPKPSTPCSTPTFPGKAKGMGLLTAGLSSSTAAARAAFFSAFFSSMLASAAASWPSGLPASTPVPAAGQVG